MSEQKGMVMEQEYSVPEIRVRDMSVSFQDNKGNEVKALTHVNLDINKSEFVSLVGPSGCGKTTLLRTCLLYTSRCV